MLTVTTPYRLFDVEVAGLQRLSPHFLRVTFSGDLSDFADCGADQRIKLVLPLPDGSFTPLGQGPWYQAWRSLPAELQNPLRTYTVRACRPGAVDVDVVLHGDGGPASRWASSCSVGDRLVLVGPNAAYPGTPGGAEWRPHPSACRVLLAGDETAVPAVAAILSRLPAGVTGTAVLEVPDIEDFLDDVVPPPGVELVWLPRGSSAPGSVLAPAVAHAARRLAPARAGAAVEEADDLVWEVPSTADCDSELYAWVAGEAGVVRSIRRDLVTEVGLDRRAVAFMGYWRTGLSQQ